VNNADFAQLTPMFGTSFFYFNQRQESFRNPDIRRGIALLIPWEEIRNTEDFFSPTDQLIPEIPAYSTVPSISEQNIEEGLRLLADAGHPFGQGLPAITIRVPANNELAAEQMVLALQKYLQTEVSIDVIPEAQDYYGDLRNDEYTIASLSWIGDYLDPLTFLALFLSDSQINEAGYSNPEYDQLIEQSNQLDGTERYNLLAQAETLLLQEGTVMPIHHTVAFHLVNTMEIEGWFPTALDIHPYRFIRKIDFVPGPGITLLP
jgi:oligopeptide transport system substrate-binding protein